MKRLALFILTMIAASPAAAADDLYERSFAGVDGGRPCYQRIYDDAHLRSHPRQTVRRIFIDFDVGTRSDETRKNGPDNFDDRVFVLRRGDRKTCDAAFPQ